MRSGASREVRLVWLQPYATCAGLWNGFPIIAVHIGHFIRLWHLGQTRKSAAARVFWT